MVGLMTTTIEKIVRLKRWIKEIAELTEEMEGSVEALDLGIVLNKLRVTYDHLSIYLKHEVHVHKIGP